MNVLVTGATGLVGMALQRIAPDWIYLGSAAGDLRIQRDTERIMQYLKPDVVIHLAARVGGIQANMARQAEFFTDNILMNTNVVHEAYKAGCKRVIGMLSTCVYPAIMPDEKYPLTEEMMFDGEPEPTNYTYAFAKRGLAVMLDAYNKQYGMQNSWIAPCNLFGEHDTYDESHSHFVAALIKKIHEAKKNGANKITLFGNGSPLRQFADAQDLGEIIKQTVEKGITESFNFAPDYNMSIREIAETALRACDAENIEIEWDTTKPNGVHRKDASNARMKKLFPEFRFTDFEQALKKTYQAYAASH